MKSKLTLLREVYNAVAEVTDSFESDDMIGPDLAYLLGAMLNDSYVEWPASRPINRVLANTLKGDHPVWDFIREEK